VGQLQAAPIGRDITLRALYGDTPPLSAYPNAARADVRNTFRQMEALLRSLDSDRNQGTKA
jgi:penicillin-binding protein 2